MLTKTAPRGILAALKQSALGLRRGSRARALPPPISGLKHGGDGQQIPCGRQAAKPRYRCQGSARLRELGSGVSLGQLSPTSVCTDATSRHVNVSRWRQSGLTLRSTASGSKVRQVRVCTRTWHGLCFRTMADPDASGCANCCDRSRGLGIEGAPQWTLQ